MADLSMTPDLRELLGAIADDPRAQLLRVKSHQAAQEGLERSPKVSSSAPFLRKAERRLLELHREELGRLLYAYAHIVRMQVPENALRVHYHDLKTPPPTKGDVDHRARALLKTKGADEPEVALLRRCLVSTHGLRPTEIIGAVLRVAPTDKAHVVLGLDLCLEQEVSGAESVLQGFLAREGRSAYDSYAWENLSFVAVQSNAFGDAFARYQAAARSDPTRVVPALYWLRFSLLAGHRESALDAARFIDRHVHRETPALEWFRQLGESDPGPGGSSEQRKLAQWVAGQSGSVSRRVIDGFK